jgi:hypothetical protein
MARLITRMADLCRQRAAEDRFLRRYGMQEPGAAPDDDDEEAAGPGWYASSRELEAGLLVRECVPSDALLAEWQAALQSITARVSRSPA